MNSKKTVRPDADIRILVACHKPSYVPPLPLLVPIQVGTALSQTRPEGMLRDNSGDNISARNKSFCELTALYWAWKNLSADYVGLFHYRRYLAFDSSLKTDEWGNINVERLSGETLRRYSLTEETMRACICDSDAVVVRAREYTALNSAAGHRSVYEEYDVAPFQHRRDLDTALAVLSEKYPAYRPYAEAYMRSGSAHECNMFILRRTLFDEYCAWLFDILFEVERRVDISSYSTEEARVFGYLGERLCGIWFTRLKAEGYRVRELPKLYVRDTAPEHNEGIIRPVFKNAVPIVLAANAGFAPHLDIMIRSILAHADRQRRYDIVVFCGDIPPLEQNIIASAAQGRPNVSIRFLRVTDYFDPQRFFVDQHLSIETYYRLMTPELMPDYGRILYLDCDMVAERDVAELYDLDLGGNLLAACSDIDVAGQVALGMNDWGHYATKKLGLASPYDYVQAGVLILDLNALREVTSSEQMMQLAVSECWRCHDQDVLNVVCRGRITRLPQRWNVLMNWEEKAEGRSRMQILQAAPPALFEEYTEARRAPYMVHFAGYQKPWNVPGCDFSEYYWKYAALSPFYLELSRKLSGEELPVPRKKHAVLRALRSVFAFLFPERSGRRRLLFRAVTLVFPYGTKRRARLEGRIHTILRETERR